MANSIGGLAIGLVIGLVFAGIGGYLYVDEQRAIENSVEVGAVVVDSWVDQDYDSDDNTYSYYPKVEYRYTYNGQEYTSTNVFPGLGSRSTGEGRAREIVADHSTGDRVTAYVNPNAPSEAYLIEESGGLFYLAFAGMGVLTVVLVIGSTIKRILTFG